MSKREFAASILGSRITGRLWSSSRGASAGLRILAYHRVLDGDPRSFPFDEELISADPDTFHRQMLFVSRNFDVITFGDLRRCELEGRPWPRRALIITFDDGYKDNYVHAFPVLKQLGLSATIFLTTGHIGRSKLFWWDRIAYCFKHTKRQQVSLAAVSPEPFPLRTAAERAKALRTVLYWIKEVSEGYRRDFLEGLSRELDVAPPGELAEGMHMTWDDVRQMHAAGIEFGSHTVTHPILANVTQAQLHHEISSSKKCIEEKIGRPVLSFAYPAGRRFRFNAAVRQAVSECGFHYAVAYDEGLAEEGSVDRYALPRIHVERGQSLSLFRANLMFPGLMLGSAGRAHAPSEPPPAEARPACM
jgi:peptidoglycan/xylan/chitin deacetylase (PgdA/CDA1 family)